MVQRIGYDSLSQDDVPGFATNKNPVLYKIDSEGSNMFFSFQGDHPQWSTDGQNFHDFYAGATNRKVYACDFLKNNRLIEGNRGNLYISNFALIIEEGCARLDYTIEYYKFGGNVVEDSWGADDQRMIMTNVNDPSDTYTLGELVDSAFAGEDRMTEWWGTLAGPGNSMARLHATNRDLYARIETPAQDYFMSGTMNWKVW
jgi:hypothetical protein